MCVCHSYFTGPGTNTYIVGLGAERVLIDAGDAGHEQFMSLLGRVLSTHCGGAKLKAVLVTHSHPDHIGGAHTAASRYGVEGCQVVKVPWAGCDGGPVKATQDGAVFTVDPETHLEALHTPGHAPDHVCWLLREEVRLPWPWSPRLHARVRDGEGGLRPDENSVPL